LIVKIRIKFVSVQDSEIVTKIIVAVPGNYSSATKCRRFVARNGDYSCQCGWGLMWSNTATEIRSEQAGDLPWLGKGGHITNTCGVACYWLQLQVTAVASNRWLITRQWCVTS